MFLRSYWKFSQHVFESGDGFDTFVPHLRCRGSPGLDNIVALHVRVLEYRFYCFGG